MCKLFFINLIVRLEARAAFPFMFYTLVGTKPRVGEPRVGSGSGFSGPDGGSGGPGGGFVLEVQVMAKPLLRPLRRNHRQDHQEHHNHYQSQLGV